MAGYFATDKRIADICFGPLLSGRRDDARSSLETRDANGMSEVTQTSVAPMRSAIQSSAASALSPTRIMLTLDFAGGRIGREPLETTKTWSRRRELCGKLGDEADQAAW